MSHDAVAPRNHRSLLAIGSVLAIATGTAGVLSQLASPAVDHELHVTTTRDGDLERTRASGHGFDVSQLPFAAMIGLTGRGSVVGESRVPILEGDQRDYSALTGFVSLSCRHCSLDYDPHFENLRVGPLSIDRLDANVVAADGKLTLASWKLASRDFRLEVAFDMKLAEHFEDSTVNGCLRFAPTEALRGRDPKLAAMLEVTGAALGADGLYNVRLAGTLGHMRRLAEVCDGSQPPGGNRAAAAADLDAAAARGITATGPDRYEIRRSLVDQLLADPMVAARAARIVPSMIDGKPAGFKLYAIRPGSFFERLGLNNGDTVVSVNGRDLATPDHCLEVYTRMHDTSSLDVAILRHGDPGVLHYAITP